MRYIATLAILLFSGISYGESPLSQRARVAWALASAPQLPVPEVEPDPPHKELAAAEISVLLPPSASLCFDGEHSTQTGPVRKIITPPLEVGKQYSYSVHCESGGNREDRIVSFTGGQKVQVEFKWPEEPVSHGTCGVASCACGCNSGGSCPCVGQAPTSRRVEAPVVFRRSGRSC